MIDKAVTAPFLAVSTFIKRKFFLVLLILALIWIAPAFIVAVWVLFRWVARFVARVAGEKAGQTVVKLLTKLFEWLRKPAVCFLVGPVIGFISPIVGFFVTAWCVTDHIKKVDVDAAIAKQLEKETLEAGRKVPLPTTAEQQRPITAEQTRAGQAFDLLNRAISIFGTRA